MHEFGDIMVIELESVFTEKMIDVLQVSSDEVIHAYDMIAILQESITEVRAEEACRSGDEYAFHLISFLPML